MEHKKPFVEALESEAGEQLQAIREFRLYSGSNVEYHKRAKMAIGVIGSYVRLRATMANERSNDLIAMRMMGQSPEAKGELGPQAGQPRKAIAQRNDK